MRYLRAFKIIYWFGLVSILGWFLALRLPDALVGRATAIDTFVFVLWMALLLAPLFSEVEVLGIKLRQEVQKAKDELRHDIFALRADITSAIDVRTSVSPHIYLSPPADAQLPTIEAQVMRAVEQAFATRDAPQAPELPPTREVDDDVIFLFQTRRSLEIEMRRIAQERKLSIPDRPVAGHQLSRLLEQAEILEPGLLRAIRDVYSVCSPAVHGEAVTIAQVAFVRDVGPELIKALRSSH